MMRKLAVTVFALSLAALGCGSDSGTQNPDVGGGTDSSTLKDTAPVTDVALPDTSIGTDTATVDVAVKLDAAVDQNTAIDGAKLDGGVKLDANGVDSQVVDGGVRLDTGSSIDTTPGVDGGTVG
jgi:hypothetical protein